MKQTRLGILTPSSNTVLEPLTSAMVASAESVTAHFARFPVTEISRRDVANAQFDINNQLAAAELLVDAHVDAIVWSGTSASWMGFEQDQRMCAAIRERTGIGASSSVLAVNDLFRAAGVTRFGLVTPYAGDVQDAIVANYAASGLTCVAERHLGETRNFAFAEVSEATIAEMIEAVAASKPDAITIMCTNMRGARIAPDFEARFGIPIFDSTSAAVWAGLRIAGADTRQLKGWGRMFDMS